MNNRDIDQDLLFKILGTFPFFMRTIMHDPKDKLFRGISKTQHKTLMLLYFKGRQHMSCLAEYLNLERGSFTPVVDGLIGHGLVRKVRDRNDRRRYILEHTQKGQRLVEEAIHRLKNRLSKRLEILSNDDFNRFIRAVEDLEEIASKL